MAQDTQYKSLPWIFQSKGLMARPATDRPPDDHFYLNTAGVLEREEEALSTRYGSTIINRDPNGTVNGTNYFLPAAPVVLARMLALGGNSYRYAALSNGALYRISGTGQGQFTSIAVGLSGQRFTALVNTCFGSATPYLFLYDSARQIKDNGTGTPTTIGIAPPNTPFNSIPYAPQILLIDSFQSNAGYGLTGTLSTAATVAGTAGTLILSGNYAQYTDATLSYAAAPDGMIALSSDFSDGVLRLKFNTNRNNNTYDIVALNNTYNTNDSFLFKQVQFSFPSASTTSIGKTLAMNLSQYQASDLIILVMQVSNPANVQQISVQFDVNGSGYTSSYYTKAIVPVSYQGNISLPQTNDPTSAVISEVFGLATGVTNIQQLGQATNLPSNDPNMPLIQPSQMGSGNGGWCVVLLQLGDFLPVGEAGNPGADWSAITGWRVQVVTNNNGSTTVAFNGLYIQGSPTSTGIGTAAGPSSYGGVGYDLRYTYWDATTLTESNPCWDAQFSITQSNPGGESTLVVLRQAINSQGRYSVNPRVTHVRIYVRGGLYGNNWYYADQIPNITSGGLFNYKYVFPDTVLAQGNILNLQNDVPVTSTLQNPICTTMTNALNPPAGTNVPTLVTVNVANAAATFVLGQIVVLGNAANLEQSFVITGGSGSFTCYVFLPHVAGEPVQAYSQPAIACNLAAVGYGQTWLAGDPNNPHLLYYTPKGYPENCPPQNYIPSPGGPSDPITAVYNFRGTIFVRTHATHYQVFPGSPPYMQSTGSKHGSPASFDWSITENEVWYQSFDGLRSFRGSDGPYRSLIIEWLYRNNPLALVPLVNLSLLSNVISAFKNNTVTFVYTGTDGKNHRLHYSLSYQRWRNDDVPATAMLAEEDTNQLLYSIHITAGAQSGWAIVYEDITLDYDDGGWINGALVQTPIALNIQTPYLDQGRPNNQKQYNDLTLDAQLNGQTLTVALLFDDNNGAVAPITLGTITGTVRDKYPLQINKGLGQQAYKTSLQITGSVTAAPVIYQADIHSEVLAEQISSYDSYWVKLADDESGLGKQLYFDYTSESPTQINVYADGVLYYSFTLPTNPNRIEVPTRVRLPALKMRLFRVVASSQGITAPTSAFQFWNPLALDRKPILGAGAKGYSKKELLAQ
jgi:hypothetical protein